MCGLFNNWFKSRLSFFLERIYPFLIKTIQIWFRFCFKLKSYFVPIKIKTLDKRIPQNERFLFK